MRMLTLILAAMPFCALAQSSDDITRDVVENHILPRFDTLTARSADLHDAASADCAATSEPLRLAYGDAFDAWIAVSHLRFGPTETDNRAYALAFWPDARGATPKALAVLIANSDPVVDTASGFANFSIAARGFYALEYLLYDPDLSVAGDAAYHCQLIRAVTGDIAAMTAAMADDWHSDQADRMLRPSADGTYRSGDEAVQELFRALSTGLEFTADTRLGRPMGTFDRPRPNRAEAWRSGRSLHHVVVSLQSLRDLAGRLALQDAAVAGALDAGFASSLALTAALDDPALAGVADVQGRLKVEVIQQSVAAIREVVNTRLGPLLGVAAGFNALDGD